MGRENTTGSSFPTHPEMVPTGSLREGNYEVRFVGSEADLDAIQRLRYEVFNLELGEGLASSAETGRDVDVFDSVCHHLLVTDLKKDEVVGCYRLQTAAMAEANNGFYSAGLFDLSGLPPDAMHVSMELGRACVASTHRSSVVLFLLWKGLGMYINHNRMRYLFGCCSLTSQDPRDGSAVLRYLQEGGYMHPDWNLTPAADMVCPLVPGEPAARKVPRLFRTYLRYGALACGPPAIDREFKTIDFLVVLDVEGLSRRTYDMFLA